MLDWKEFLSGIIIPTLKHLNLDGEAPRKLVLGTAVHESTVGGITHLKQQNGPALGVFQIEPSTAEDVWTNFLRYRPELRRKVEDLVSPYPGQDIQLQGNLFYATAICRLVYYRRKEPIPLSDDIKGLAMYWKQFYNTPIGRGSPKDWIEHFNIILGLF